MVKILSCFLCGTCWSLWGPGEDRLHKGWVLHHLRVLSELWSLSGARTGAEGWAQLEPGSGAAAFCSSSADLQVALEFQDGRWDVEAAIWAGAESHGYLGIPDIPQLPELSAGEGRQSPNPRGSCSLQELSTRETVQRTGWGQSASGNLESEPYQNREEKNPFLLQGPSRTLLWQCLTPGWLANEKHLQKSIFAITE